MRSWKWLACVLLVATACGGAAVEPTDTTVEEVTTTTTAPPTTSTTQPATTTTQVATTTTVPPPARWTVAALGRAPTAVFADSGALGSGCSPGTDALPDGVWFGWIEDTGSSSVEFDLACLWPGRLEPAASNDAARIRTVAATDDTLVYLTEDPVTYSNWSGDTTSANNAPGLPDSLPYWLFVNNGQVTEISEYPEPVNWLFSATAWPEDLAPGCCATDDVAPPSPAAPLPESGWPDDGFYGAYLVDPNSRLSPDGGYEIEISKLISCGDKPDLCSPDWTAVNVTSDPDAPTIERLIPFDSETTVVLMPIFSDTALVGDGGAFEELIADISNALAPIGDPIENWIELTEVASAHRNDLDYPLGIADTPDSTEDWPIGYRGPGGTNLTVDPPWMALEIRNGLPIVYIHTGMVAG